MQIFAATLEQTAFLFSFIVIGYVLSRGKFVPDNTPAALSRLENNLLIPALVLGTFVDHFTTAKLTAARDLLLSSLGLEVAVIGLAWVCARLCSRDKYEQNLFTYGLSFSNFGFMGNAVVSALFPDVFLDYLIFTLPLWALIYLWGVPVLLMGHDGEKVSIVQRLKSFVNPMFFCTLLGMIIGLINVPVPTFARRVISTAGSCMSPIAMLLTGMTIARFQLKEVLQLRSIYLATVFRLLVFPLLFVGVAAVFPLPKTLAVCMLCSLAMPLGLNTIIIPNALGKNVRVPTGMALVSHFISCLTIPVVFMIFSMIHP